MVLSHKKVQKDKTQNRSVYGLTVVWLPGRGADGRVRGGDSLWNGRWLAGIL